MNNDCNLANLVSELSKRVRMVFGNLINSTIPMTLTRPSTSRLSIRVFCSSSVTVNYQTNTHPDTDPTDLSQKAQKKSLHPDILSLCCETMYPKKRGVESSLWDRIMEYKSGYIEKTILLNEDTAMEIAQSIKIHTRGNKDTAFFDGEGGLCQVADKIQKMDIFSSVSVLEKDVKLAALHDYAKRNYLHPDTAVHPVNLCAEAVECLKVSHYESSLIKHLPESSEFGVSDEVPSYSLVATVSHGFIKYLNSRILYRDNPFGEFFNARPEFFFIVPIRTYFHLCMSTDVPEPETVRISELEMRYIAGNRTRTQLYNLYHNVLFQTFFDFCLVNILPRSSYYPWKKYQSATEHKIKPGKERVQLLYEANNDQLMMIYVRPKKPADVDIGDPKYFSHFIFHLLRNKTEFLCAILERWGKGWGILILDMFQDEFNFTTQVVDLDIIQILDLYKVLVNLPDFSNSVFAAEADNAHSDSEIEEVNEDDMEAYRIMFDRRQAGGKSD